VWVWSLDEKAEGPTRIKPAEHPIKTLVDKGHCPAGAIATTLTLFLINTERRFSVFPKPKTEPLDTT
jgi:hypothetical protein